MKRRNADIGKLRRPLKRTKITEGMYGNSMLYLKFVMLWASIVLADYMLEFRFEFLWPFWMMLRSVYDSYKYQGLAFSVFFICIALTSDMICFFFVPVQYIFFAASTYVWVQYVWYSFADKGVCLPTVAVCCFIVYMEGVRGVGGGAGVSAGWATGCSRGLAAHAVGFPAVTLGVGVKAYVGRRLRARTQRHVRQQNEFYFQLMRDALPVSGISSCGAECIGECECNSSTAQTPATGAGVGATPPVKAANGAARRRCRPENGHCAKEKEILLNKLEQLEQHLERKQAKEREKSQNHVTISHTPPNSVGNSHTSVGNSHHQVGNSHSHSNGVASGPGCLLDDDDKHIHSKGGAKTSKYDKKEANTANTLKDTANTLKEEKRKHKNRDKDKETFDSHKSTEQTKEQISNNKEVESTTESVKIKELNVNIRERDREARDREREARERDREARERDREAREKEREREREREQREKEARTNRETIEELRRVRAELATSRSELAAAKSSLAGARSELAAAKTELATARAAEAEAKKQLAAEKQRRQERHTHTKSCSWGRERAALERRLENERRARHSAEQQLQHNQDNGWCQRCACGDSEAGALRRELTRARDAHRQLQRDLQQAHDQVRTLESNASTEAASNGCGVETTCGAGAGTGWAARAGQLERALSAETRVKLDLLSALGDANRRMHIQDSIINRQEKELEELKAQMLAVMPTEFVGTVGVTGSVSVSKLRLSDNSPLDPNATVYTPKQLCSDA